MDLGFIWLLIIAFIIIMYILLDGFTLGVGLLFPLVKDDHERDLMVTTVLPVWDGNETWLVFAGASLYGAFPLAFSTLLPIWYLPIMLLIFGLLLRGIAFEFRLKAKATKYLWDWSLFMGSLMAVIAQGLIVASFVTGFDDSIYGVIPVDGHNFTLFGVFCSIALIIAYALLGSARLIKKTSGELQDKFYTISKKLQWFLMGAVIFVGVYRPQLSNPHATFWLDSNNYFFTGLFVLIIIGLFVIHSIALKTKRENIPFTSLIMIFVLSYLGLVGSKLPYIVPTSITFMEAKSDDGALLFMLIGAVVLIPLLLFYTAYAYKIFGGKTNEKIHY